MLRYIIGRLIQLVLVVLGVATLLFVLLRLSGDPALVLAGGEYASADVVADVRRRLGLDQPLFVQYLIFVSNLVRLEFGQSYFLHESALKVVLSRLPATLQLSLSAFVLSLIVAFPIGIISGIRRNSTLGRGLMLLAFLGQSVPVFWLGLLLVLLFSVQWRLLPAFGSGEWKHLILPTIALSGFSMARLARLVRSGMIEALNQDYIRTARAKGLAEKVVILRHAIKNMLIPIVTVIGMQIGIMVGGTVIVETIFSYPGIGLQLVQSVTTRDYPVVQAIVFVVSVAVVVANLLVDMTYTVLDPRIRLG